MQDDGEQLYATGLDGSRPSSTSTTEESLETMTLQDERAPLKRKSDEDLGNDQKVQKRRLSTEETESSGKTVWGLNDNIQNTGSHGQNGSEEREICEPSEPQRRVIISTFFLLF